MDHLLGNFLIIMIIIYAIVAFIIYHKIFSVIYFDTFKGLLGEFLGCGIFGLIMALLTVHYWKIVCIGLIIAGVLLILAADSGTKKVIIFIIVAILVIFLFRAGRKADSATKANEAKATYENTMRQYSEDKDSELLDKYFYGEWHKKTDDGATTQITKQGFDGRYFAFDEIKIYKADSGHFDLTMYIESSEDKKYYKFLLKFNDGKMKIYDYKDNKDDKSYVETWYKADETTADKIDSTEDGATQKSSISSKYVEVNDFIGIYTGTEAKIEISKDDSVENGLILNITSYQWNEEKTIMYEIPVVVNQKISLDTTQKLKDTNLVFSDANQYYDTVTLKKTSDSQLIINTSKANIYFPITGTYNIGNTSENSANDLLEKNPVNSSTSTSWSKYTKYYASISGEDVQLDIKNIYSDGFDFVISKENGNSLLEGRAYFYSDQDAYYKENGYDIRMTQQNGNMDVIGYTDKSSGIESKYSITQY